MKLFFSFVQRKLTFFSFVISYKYLLDLLYQKIVILEIKKEVQLPLFHFKSLFTTSKWKMKLKTHKKQDS